MRCSIVDDIGEDYLVFDCVIKYDKWGITTASIAQSLKLPLIKVRKSLKSLKERGWVVYFAHWYGKNGGYTRKYKLSNKARKIEAGGK